MKVIAEIKILKGDNIAKIATQYYPDLKGPCIMQLRTNKILKEERRYLGSTRRIKTEGRSVHDFFVATDFDEKTGRHISKWKIIINEMCNPADIIEEITLIVSKVI
jgi:hypothetical protein